MKRYNMRDVTPYVTVHPDGEWVRYEDHVEAMKRIAGAPVAQGLTDERDAFEAAYRGICGLQGRDLESEFDRDEDGDYIYAGAAEAWKVWSARAVIAQAAPCASTEKCFKCGHPAHSDSCVNVAPSVQQGEQLPVELRAVAETVAEGAGFWATCTGCYDTEDGRPTQKYAHSDVFGCELGNGCRECGGLGAVWDDTDYAAMAEFMEQRDAAPAPSASPAAHHVDDLVALVRQLAHSLRKAAPGNNLAERAVDYLKRHGMQGSPLRTVSPAAVYVDVGHPRFDPDERVARPAASPAALTDDMRDRLVAISAAIAEQDDRSAQSMIRELLAAPSAALRQHGEIGENDEGNLAGSLAMGTTKEVSRVASPADQVEPVAYVNADELDNIMMDDRTATIAGVRDGWRRKPLYAAAPAMSSVNEAGRLRAALWAIANTYDDHELRQKAQEAYNASYAAMSATPPAAEGER